MKKCYRVYKIEEPVDDRKYVVYKYEYGVIVPTYYRTKKAAEQNKNYVAK